MYAAGVPRPKPRPQALQPPSPDKETLAAGTAAPEGGLAALEERHAQQRAQAAAIRAQLGL